MTDQRTKNCTLCMLIPFILGIAGLTALYWYAKDSKAEYIENDLSFKSNQQLKDNQVGGVIVNMNGRDATLTGTVINETRSQEIDKIIADLPGIRSVDNQLEIAGPKAIEVAPEPDIALAPDPQPNPKIEVKVEVVEKLLQTLDLSGITFLFGSDEITPKGKLVLDDVVAVLKDHSKFDVIIRGYTDNVGDDDLNLQLSQQRAQSVLNYLTSTGIQTEHLTAAGFGESSPIADNETVEGRALNRRIEFVVSRK